MSFWLMAPTGAINAIWSCYWAKTNRPLYGPIVQVNFDHVERESAFDSSAGIRLADEDVSSNAMAE